MAKKVLPSTLCAEINRVFKADDAGVGPCRYHGGHTSLAKLVVLPQPRQTFLGIAELALDMARKGILMLPIVGRFSLDEAKKYFEVIGHLKGLVLDPKILLSRVSSRVDILIVGERRYRALKHLWDVGCIECLEQDRHHAPGDCFKRHFARRDDCFEVRVANNIPALQALAIQFSENIHMAVPVHEEALAYVEMFKLIRAGNPQYAIAQFARYVGRSADTISRALKYCQLPEAIQGMVEQRLVPYGLALELARLQDAGLRGGELDHWLRLVLVRKINLTEFSKMVSKTLAERQSRQGSFAVFDIHDHEEERARHVRGIAAAGLVGSVQVQQQYLRIIRSLVEQGSLGTPGSIYASGSPRRNLAALCTELRAMANVLEKVAPLSEAESNITSATALAAAIDKISEEK